MTEKEFKRQIALLLAQYRKRIMRLKAISEGAKVKRVKVRRHWVKGHWVSEHERFL